MARTCGKPTSKQRLKRYSEVHMHQAHFLEHVPGLRDRSSAVRQPGRDFSIRALLEG